MFGLLNVHKPSGMTSRDAVNCVQRLIRPTKVGHAGTLDPLAHGVLVLCVGSATRLISHIQRMPKSYTGTFVLGRESDTEDIEGNIREHADAYQPSLEEIQSQLPDFLGTIMQRPPAFSALKVAGRRAYDLARSGQKVILEPRPIEIHELKVVHYSWPQLVVDIRCGSGTYVRSLGRDLAERLGTTAVMSALTRTAIGAFSLDDAVMPGDLTLHNIVDHVQPARRAVSTLPTVRLTDEELLRIRQGLTITNRFGNIGRPENPCDRDNQEISALSPKGDLAAILVPRGDGLGPLRNFVDSD